MDRVAASLQRDGVAAGESDRDLRRQLDALRGGLPRRPARRRRRRAARRIGHAGELPLDARRRRRAPALRRRQRRRRSAATTAGLPRRISLDGTARRHRVRRLARRRPARAPTAVEIAPEMAFNIIYSSGTTGTPKGIVQPHGMRWTHVMRGGRFGYSRETVTLLATPLYSNTTLVVFFPTVAFGGTVVLMEKFDVDRYLALAERHRVTHTMLVPVQYQRLMASPRFGDARPVVVPDEVLHQRAVRRGAQGRRLARWPGGLVEFYGMTEGGGTCILAAHEHPDKLHTVGQPRRGPRHPPHRRGRPRAAARRDRRGRRPLGGDDDRLPRPAGEDRRGRVVRRRRASASSAPATSAASTTTASSRSSIAART